MRIKTRSAAGFTLTELLVVVGLLGMILAATYAASQAIMAGGRVNEAQAAFARDSGEPLRIINKSLMQATAIETALPNQIMVTTDRNLDDVLERMRVTATADGKLLYEVWINNAKPPAAPSTSIAWSTNCVNDSDSPLFRYYKIDGSNQTEVHGYDAEHDADMVKIDLRLSSDATDFRSEQSVLLRNLQ